MGILIVYMCLKIKYPGKGLKVITNIFKEAMPFEQAIRVLKEGKRIRRKSERKGFTRMVVTDSKSRMEKFGTYWEGDTSISDHCTFSIEDVLATDWIIDE